MALRGAAATARVDSASRKQPDLVLCRIEAGSARVLNTYMNYQLIAKDIGKAIDRVETEPMVKRETEYYLANITKVKSIDDLMKDDRLFRYAMKAHGLGDMSYAKAFMVKAMKEGIDDSDSFANKLTDKRYYEFVKTFDFVSFGETTTVRTRAQQGTVDMYLRQTLEENAGKQNEGVRLALYFERKAGDLTNFYEVLADPALSRVVRTALGHDFAARIEVLVDAIHAAGQQRLPADRRYANRRAAEREGIPLKAEDLARLKALAAD